MMLCSSLSSSIILRHTPAVYKPPTSATFPSTLYTPFKVNHQLGRRKTSGRGISVVTRAGASATSYIFAFLLPLTLLAATFITSVRIADNLDQKFLEELAINEAILEAEEDENNGGDNENKDRDKLTIAPNKETAPIRTRNRPKREVDA